MSNRRKYPLSAEVIPSAGVLMVTIGLDTLSDLRRRLGLGSNVTDGDLADFLVNGVDSDETAHTPFEAALRLAWHRAKLWDDDRMELEPDREFWR